MTDHPGTTPDLSPAALRALADAIVATTAPASDLCAIVPEARYDAMCATLRAVADRDDIARLNASGDYRHSSAPPLVPTDALRALLLDAREDIEEHLLDMTAHHQKLRHIDVTAATLARINAALGLTLEDIT